MPDLHEFPVATSGTFVTASANTIHSAPVIGNVSATISPIVSAETTVAQEISRLEAIDRVRERLHSVGLSEITDTVVAYTTSKGIRRIGPVAVAAADCKPFADQLEGFSVLGPEVVAKVIGTMAASQEEADQYRAAHPENFTKPSDRPTYPQTTRVLTLF